MRLEHERMTLLSMKLREGGRIRRAPRRCGYEEFPDIVTVDRYANVCRVTEPRTLKEAMMRIKYIKYIKEGRRYWTCRQAAMVDTRTTLHYLDRAGCLNRTTTISQDYKWFEKLEQQTFI